MENNNQVNLPVSPKHFVPPQKGEQIFCEGTCYYLGEPIGQGGFGVVYECTDDWSNSLVAKVIQPQSRTYDQVKNEWLTELRNLSTLRHPCITYIHQAFEYRDTFYLIVERCSYDLTRLIEQPGSDGNIWLPYIARDVLNGLDFIHKQGYVHKDMHPGNIFVSHHYDFMVPSKDPVWSFKIGDLGISRLEGDMQLFNIILAQWMLPPEYLNPTEFGMIGKQIDIYHVGLLLLGLLLNRIPQFSREDILNGVPRQTAEGLNSPYAPAIAKALRRHVVYRTQTAIDMWREIFAMMPKL
ncbi:MAG: protein kinase family protein, partial [Spirochaetota bacterium]